MKERVQKLMAQANLGSRRACEEIIRDGRVAVNGQVIHLGDQADPETDVVEVDGKRLKFGSQAKVYIAIYKPKNVLTTTAPHAGDTRRALRDMLPVAGHLFTIGRLDADSEGLVVFTNDGEMANKLSHPRYHHTKTYKVIVMGIPTAETIAKWENGVFLAEEGMTAPAVVHVSKGSKGLTTLNVVMIEGKKRQIRRVASLLGHPVRRLIRTQIGMLEVGAMHPGDWHELTAQEIKDLSTPSPEGRDILQKMQRPARRGGRAEGGYSGRERDERRPRRTASSSGEFGDRPRPPRRPDDGQRKSYGERRSRPTEGAGAESGSRPRPPRRPDDGERKSFGERRSRPAEGAGAESGNRPRPPRRSDDGERKSYGERWQRPAGATDRPRRDDPSRPERSTGGSSPRKRPSGKPDSRPPGERPPRPRRPRDSNEDEQ